MKRVGVVSLDTIDNIGEELLRHITEVLIESIAGTRGGGNINFAESLI